ncbi:TPA: hypothetical protein JLJ42_001162 [Escherichia coli]|uniref:hypothetical protein n=1 Tax=Escherichia coli TaxID=562 RepID=UPI001641007B|nr:hypothetical protein [Escherichia coli]EJZ9501541.1 hypothetical protein [Escherichia coli]MCO4884204.1 hypothetical protein [Escherichia coli]HAW0524838.1 hypothetical protein [Escherichia coli]HCN8394626.1 hypothetical protein [Escherichia coli]HDW3617434.1 hypothetical protein [Escherichia coli]
MSELAIIEIKPEQAPALYVPNGLEMFLEQIRAEVNEVPDLSTAKGRARVASLSALVSRSKTAIEKPGRDYLRHLKEAVKPAEAELRRFVTACDELRDEVRRPLTEWEAEQERIAAENQMNAWHEEALEMNADFDRQFAARIESDHEIALMMNEKHDRDREEARAEAERKRIAHEEELKRQAAEQARRDAEAAAQRDREEAARREAELKAAAERAERERIETQQRAEREKKEAAERAERDKQEAIAAERRRQEEAEAARQAEAKRIADEEAKRSADKEHRRTINRKVIADLVAQGIEESVAKDVVCAVATNKIEFLTINY